MAPPRLAVGLVSASYPPGPTGGTEQVVRALARELFALGHAPRIVTGFPGGAAGVDVLRGEVDGLQVSYLPLGAGEDGAARNGRLEELVRAELRGCEIAHVHHWDALSSGLARALAETMPVVATLHDLLAACPLRGPELEAELAACERIFVPTATHLANLNDAAELPIEKVHLLDHGLCTELPAARRGRTYWDGVRPLTVLHFGHREEAKGTLDLARALAGLPAGSVELVVAGGEREPGLDDRLREAAGGLELRIFGPYGPRELRDLAGLCDLAAFPWREDVGDSLVVEEALALGLPVWVSDRGAAMEVLDRRAEGRKSPGRVLSAGDVGAWREAFLGLLAEPDRLARYRQALPTRIRTAEEAARELEEHYLSLLFQPA